MDLPPYKRPWFLSNAHFETIWPSLFRQIVLPSYYREQISTDDDDLLDLDWLQSGHKRLAIISHGLEGDSQRHYVVGMVHAMAANGWDVLAWNFRGCGGDINLQPRFTHNGSTADLDAVVRHALEKYNYETISLVGFSMGGNISLVYLGRESARVPDEVKAAVCFSVPCDLAASSLRLAEAGNALYMKRFMRLMGQKVRRQSVHFPAHFPIENYHKLKTFHDFDDCYTAPLHGFRDAHDYWEQCSSNRYLKYIRQPVWIVNASNDPFLSPSCSPGFCQHENSLVSLVSPKHGGHCGFSSIGRGRMYWSEQVTVDLLSDFR